MKSDTCLNILLKINKKKLTIFSILYCIILSLHSISDFFVALPDLRHITNSSLIAVVGETVDIRFTVVRAVPAVTTVSWNFTAGLVVDNQLLTQEPPIDLLCVSNSECSFSHDM